MPKFNAFSERGYSGTNKKFQNNDPDRALTIDF